MSEVAKKPKAEKAAKNIVPIKEIRQLPVGPMTPINVSVVPSEKPLSERCFEQAFAAKTIEERTQWLAAGNEQQSKEDARRVEDKQRAFWAAFAEMQSELPVIDRKGSMDSGVAYALYEDIVPLINPVLTKFGFGLSFRTEEAPGAVKVTCILGHTSGHQETSSYPFPFDTTGEKNDNQSASSAISYGKRVLSTAMLNVVTRGQDDDAAATSAKTATISAEQVAELKKLIAEAGRTEPVFLRLVAKVSALTDIKAANLETLKRELHGMIAKGALV